MNLSIQNVSKQYRRDFWGLRDFSLELGAGVLGLLGPNGAGEEFRLKKIASAPKGKIVAEVDLSLNTLGRRSDSCRAHSWHNCYGAVHSEF